VNRIKHTIGFTIFQPIDSLFPLFSPEGERLWVPDWTYENIMGTTDLSEDYVFVTKNHDHTSTDAIWLVKRYKPESHFIQFYKVEPEDKVGVVTVQCFQKAENLTEVEVSYEYIGLSEKGCDFIKSFSFDVYERFISEWKELLIQYYESRC
jgi:hypothetical protein